MTGQHITVDATIKDPKFFWDMFQNQDKKTNMIVVEV